MSGVDAFPCQLPPVRDLPFCNTSLGAEERAELLVSNMSLLELVPQTLTNAPAIARLGVEAYNYWSEGLHGVVADNVTCFPEPIGLGAAFNMTLVTQMAVAISSEARVLHLKKHPLLLPIGGLTYFAPNINIFRDPRWGRGQETPGEDPFLTQSYAVSFIRGMQGVAEDPYHDPKYLKTVACAKHAFAYSLENSDGVDRHHFNAIVSDLDMQETYLPAFRAAVERGGARSVMCSYNAINGVPTCASGDLFQGMVRGQWGFTGYVVSDCDAIQDIYATHHYTRSHANASALALHAGVDLDCGEFYLFLTEALAQGLVSGEQLRTAVTRMFTQRFALGMFDDPASNRYNAVPADVVNGPAHKALALEAARQSLVLLRNRNGLLPLSTRVHRRVAVIGPNANNSIALLGNYNGIPHHVATPLEAIEALGVHVEHVEGCPVGGDVDLGIARAVRAAEQSDVAILFLGLDQTQEREEHDRTSLDLPGLQMNLTRAVVATGKPVVVVFINGGPLAAAWVRDNVDAILEAWYPGQMGAQAIADALFGTYNPGGRLPVTFYPSDYVTQINMSDMSMRTPPGRTYRFYTGDPVFSFGEGLSYTTFNYSNITATRLLPGSRLSRASLDAGSAAIAGNFSVRVTNTGSRAGDDVVLAFLRKPQYAVSDPPPIKELFGFQRVYLQPGESVDLSFPLPAAALAQLIDRSALSPALQTQAATCLPPPSSLCPAVVPGVYVVEMGVAADAPRRSFAVS